MMMDISLQHWLYVFFSIFALQVLFQLIRLITKSTNSSFLSILRMTVLDTTMICWLVFGNYVYFTNSGNEPTIMRYLMLSILCVGYFSMIVYAYVLYSLMF